MVGANHDTANMQTHRDPCLGSDSAQTDNDLQKELDIQYMKGTYRWGSTNDEIVTITDSLHLPRKTARNAIDIVTRTFNKEKNKIKIKYAGKERLQLQVAAIVLAARIQGITVPLKRFIRLTRIPKEQIAKQISFFHRCFPHLTPTKEAPNLVFHLELNEKMFSTTTAVLKGSSWRKTESPMTLAAACVAIAREMRRENLVKEMKYQRLKAPKEQHWTDDLDKRNLDDRLREEFDIELE